MTKPNLLYIFTDEQRFDTLAAYGNNLIDMPNLNSLAEKSIVFDRSYVTQPVCTPSRSSLLTGLYPHTNGCIENNVPLDESTPCFPELMKDAGYRTAYYGKWHLGDEIFKQHGFDEWRAIEDAYSRYYSENRNKHELSSYHKWLNSKGIKPKNKARFSRAEATSLPEKYGKPAYLAEESSDFIRRNKDNPFVLFVNFLEPHMPFFGPRDEQYNPQDIPLPETFNNTPKDNQPRKAVENIKKFYENGIDQKPLKTEEDWRNLRARYYGLCSLVDTYAGKIIDTLKECSVYENTIIVFTSDHGDMMGSHGRMLTKCTMFEEAVKVPMLMRLPGQAEQLRVNGPVSQIDLLPTIMDYMEQPVCENLEGQSLRPVIEGDRKAKDPVFIEWHPMQKDIALSEEIKDARTSASVSDHIRTVITPDNWKFNCSLCGEHELYDLNNDPFELNNLADKSEYKSKIENMFTEICKWQKRTGDELKLSMP